MDKLIYYLATADFSILPTRADRFTKSDLDTDYLIVDNLVQARLSILLAEAFETILDDSFPPEELFTPDEEPALNVLTKAGGAFIPMNKL